MPVSLGPRVPAAQRGRAWLWSAGPAQPPCGRSPACGRTSGVWTVVRRGRRALSLPRGTVTGMETTADLMLVTGVLARCGDCASEQILMPVDDTGAYCCTVCDAAVLLWDVAVAVREDDARSVA